MTTNDQSVEGSTKHTPTPWKVDPGSYQRTNGRISIVEDKPGITHSAPVADVPIYEHDGTATATAAFIVRCVNSHDALVKALTKIATQPEGVYNLDREQYLKNVIAWCQETAQAALSGEKEPTP